MDLKTFKEFLHGFFQEKTENFADHYFRNINKDKNGKINFREFLLYLFHVFVCLYGILRYTIINKKSLSCCIFLIDTLNISTISSLSIEPLPSMSNKPKNHLILSYVLVDPSTLRYNKNSRKFIFPFLSLLIFLK
jgi:hypothetical protein